MLLRLEKWILNESRQWTISRRRPNRSFFNKAVSGFQLAVVSNVSLSHESDIFHRAEDILRVNRPSPFRSGTQVGTREMELITVRSVPHRGLKPFTLYSWNVEKSTFFSKPTKHNPLVVLWGMLVRTLFPSALKLKRQLGLWLRNSYEFSAFIILYL